MSRTKVILLSVLIVGASLASTAAYWSIRNRKSDTQKMAELLRHAYDSENPKINFLANKKRVEMIKARLARARKSNEIISLKVALAFENLNAGNAEDAIEGFKWLVEKATDEELVEARSPFLATEGEGAQIPPRIRLKYALGLSHLRYGEIQNCVGEHNQRSCIFPIRGHGVHRHRAGSHEAVHIFQDLLGFNGGNQRLRWVLNLAYMTLGEYPDKVPKKFLLPPKLFESERAFPAFVDIAAKSGIDILRGAGSSVMDDFRNVGLMDVVLSSPRLNAQIRLFENNGKKGADFAFDESTAKSGILGITDGKNLQQGDFDNDGCLDIYVVRGAYKQEEGRQPGSLLRGHCDGTFEDVTERAGLMKAEPTFTAAWWDYDNDGWLDLITPHESAPPHDFYSARMKIKRRFISLYRNNRDGTFKEVSKEAGLDISGNFKGVLWADVDNDGRGDLMVAETTGSSRLYRNEGPDAQGRWHFRDISVSAGLPPRLKGRTLIFFDYDNDGDEDLFIAYGQTPDPIRFDDVIASYTGRKVSRHPYLFRNDGHGVFEDVSEQMGLARAMPIMGANFGDIDNDGYLDLYFGTGATAIDQLVPNRMFWNDGGKRFLDVTTASDTGHLQKGHGISIGDVDGDGQPDVLAQMGGAFEGDEYWAALFKNPGFTNNWIQIKLRGTKSNAAAFGARIKISVSEEGKPRAIYRRVNSGGSRGSNPLLQHIGLGRAQKIDKIEITWPATGETSTLENIEVNQLINVREPESGQAATAVSVPRGSPSK